MIPYCFKIDVVIALEVVQWPMFRPGQADREHYTLGWIMLGHGPIVRTKFTDILCHELVI